MHGGPRYSAQHQLHSPSQRLLRGRQRYRLRRSALLVAGCRGTVLPSVARSLLAGRWPSRAEVQRQPNWLALPPHGRTGAVAVGSFTWSIQDTATNPTSAYFSTFTRSWELALGALIGIATTRATVLGRRQATAASVTGVVLLVVGCIVINSSSAFPGYIALFPTVGAALVIVAGITDLPSAEPADQCRADAFSGAYLLFPVLVALAPNRVRGALYPHAITQLTIRFVILGLALAVATVSFYVIERPFRRVSVDGKRVDRLRSSSSAQE